MTGFAVRAPRGEVPRRSERLLPDNYAQVAENCKTKSGRVDPIKGMQQVHTSLASAINTLYRYRFGELENWLVFPQVVDVARSPVDADTLGRFYYSGDGEPRMSTYAAAIVGAGPYPVGWYVLGVAPPVTAMSITVTGGVGVNEDRSYVYTFVTPLGEESGPSPATLKTGKVDGSWDITGMDAAPPNSGTISAAVKDTPLPGQVEVTLNTVFGLVADEEVTFASVAGMTDLNGTFKLVSVDAGTSKVVVALTTTQTYSAAADTWTRVAPHNTTGMTKRIYRTVGSNTDYKFVAEIAVAATTYSDTIPAATVSLNAGITTLATLPPPKDLHSMVLLDTNSLAGLSGNQFCMSEPGKPYSWPLSHRYSFPGKGVRLVPTSSAAIILTDNFPHIANVSIPEASGVTKIEGAPEAPCVSATGAVDVGGVALYPSHEGLMLASSGGVRNITADLFTMADWQQLKPETFRAAYYDGFYYADHATVSVNRLLLIDIREPDSIGHCNESVDAIYTNPWDRRLYVAKANKIYKWDEDDLNRYVASWRSKAFQLGSLANMGAAQVHARYQDLIALNNQALAYNQALMANILNVNGEIACAEVSVYEIASSALIPVPQQTGGYLQFTLVRDGDPVFTKLVTSSKAFKLPAGKKSELYAFEIASSIGWESAHVAEGMAELKAVP